MDLSKLKLEALPHEPSRSSDSSAQGCVRSGSESLSHVEAGSDSINRSRCQTHPMAYDNICNYVLQFSRRLTSGGTKCPTPTLWNDLKTGVFVFLAEETGITKIHDNNVADVLCNKRWILPIKVMVRSWTLRTLGWQLESPFEAYIIYYFGWRKQPELLSPKCGTKCLNGYNVSDISIELSIRPVTAAKERCALVATLSSRVGYSFQPLRRNVPHSTSSVRKSYFFIRHSAEFRKTVKLCRPCTCHKR